MNDEGAHRRERHAVAAAVVFGAGLVTYGVVSASWDLATGQRGRPPLTVLLLASVAFTAWLPALGRRAERLANWAAFGHRADGYEVVSELTRRMNNSLAIEEVLPRLAEAAARTARGDRGEARLWLPDGLEQRQVWPPEAPDAAGESVTVPVRHGGATIGQLGVQTDLAGRPDSGRQRLSGLSGPAGLALASVGLTMQLRRRLEEVEELNGALRASQDRLVDARAAERRRIRAQTERQVLPHLDALERHLALAGMAPAGGAPAGMPPTSASLADAKIEASAALDALRLLARTIFSSVLADSGIVPALLAWSDQAGATLTVRADGDLGALHRCPAVEAALHFTCVTWLDEIEGPSDVVIEVGDDAASATLSWSADGRSASGQVLQLLQDRADALHGELSLDPSARTLRVRLPVAADGVAADGVPAPDVPAPGERS